MFIQRTHRVNNSDFRFSTVPFQMIKKWMDEFGETEKSKYRRSLNEYINILGRMMRKIDLLYTKRRSCVWRCALWRQRWCYLRPREVGIWECGVGRGRPIWCWPQTLTLSHLHTSCHLLLPFCSKKYENLYYNCRNTVSI